MDDSNEIKKAKEIGAGPLGKEMARFPLSYANSILIGPRPLTTTPPKINSGTVSLIKLDVGPVAITCYHVIEEYRSLLEKDSEIVFQIGNIKLDPIKLLIDENRDLDIVTLSLNEKGIEEQLKDEEMGSSFFKPILWPPNDVQEGEFLAFGGFPGTWRQQPSSREVIFDSFSSGACKVGIVRDDYIQCHFEREYWVQPTKNTPRDSININNLGGLSGSPAFILRSLYWEFVGIVYEYMESFDILRIRPAKFIRKDGTINSG